MSSNLLKIRSSTFKLPPPISGWPTPWLDIHEVEHYLLPILRDHQWRVNFVTKAQRPVPTLEKRYNFNKGPSALTFMRDVIDIANAENHHPTSLQYGEDSPHVSLGIRTHSAKIPPPVMTYLLDHIRPETDPPTKSRYQGITLRDIRFALLVDQCFETYHKNGDAGVLDVDASSNEVPPFTEVEPLLRHLLSHL
ncbi:hypothetical protein Moror_884 [Moniliophthora roreri MCA 2997]|uniref:4a-hydroxytetrahydrobiopterin dehydratase n=1 Tax=Moniliophthora roreri (strain MCA 2997) TaxID=1381753 RepID=V2XYL1_MONRO|nr:hypothetical protein Moror_884 [Moniliophthora roreri MCA 2997]KAI3622499.1 hypothetical protein WG66_015177 [Moniliophthora roreri]